MKPEWPQIQAAREFLRGYFAPTRLLPAPSLSNAATPVYLKMEAELPTGSFKVRGALYALQQAMSRRAITEVVASSTGNHGAAVAYAAKLLGVRATIVLPRSPNPVKRQRIQELGANIVECGEDLSEAMARAGEYAQAASAFLLADATDGDLPAGTATIGCEIVEQLPNVAEIWVPIGDTALIRGVAAAAKHLCRGVRIVGVQAERAPSYYLSWQQGAAVSTETCDTIADGLATRTPFAENVAVIRELVDDIRLVSEEHMLAAVARLLIHEHIVAEPSGAATTAAWLAKSPSAQSGPVVLLVSGSNISHDILRRAISQ